MPSDDASHQAADSGRPAPSSPAQAARAPDGRVAARRARTIARLEASGRYPRWVLFAALAGMFATTFPITILTVALAPIAAEFGTSQSTIAWVISAPMLLSAVALPLLGKLGDLYGHRRVFLLGFAGSTATAAVTALAWDAGSLISFRTLAAVLGGATQPTSMALIFGVYAPADRVRAMGWWSMTGAAAPALGLVVGGPLVDLLGWRVVFVLQAALSLAALALAAVVLRETARQRVRFDLAGSATLAFGVAGFMFALGEVRELGPASPWIWGSVALGALGLAAFAAVEPRAEAPLLPLGLLGRRAFVAPICANAFMSAAYMGAFVLAPAMLIEVFGFSIAAAAAAMLLRTLTLTLSSPLGGTLGFRIGERAAALVGCVVMTLALGVMALGIAERSLAAVAVGLVLQGLGHGLGLPSLTSAISNAVAEEDLGVASAANRLTGSVGAAFGITVLSLVYADLRSEEAFARAFAVGAALSALSVAAALPMSRPARSEPAGAAARP